MSSLTEFIVEDASRRVKSEIGRVKFCEAFPISLFTCESIRRLNPAIPEQARAAIKRYVKARFKRRWNP
jgi:hypothetical protein